MERQFHDGTLYSANIENHAKPNSVPVFSANFKEPYILPGHVLDAFSVDFFHPHLRQIPIDVVDNRTRRVLDFFVVEKLLKKNNTHYLKHKIGFPRVLVHLKSNDPTILPYARIRNPHHYEVFDKLARYIRKFRPEFRDIMQSFHTINNIPVADIRDSVQPKLLFEKVLGHPDHYYDNAMAWGKSKQTLFAAAKRQMKVAPTPDSRVADDFIKHATQIIEKEIGEDLTHFGYSYNAWYNHLPYKKQLLIDKIQRHLWSQETDIELTSQEIEELESMNYEAICKTEIQSLDGKPRMVCSIPQIIKFTMGPVTWMLEEICAKKLHGYCGGKNLTQMAKEINEFIDQGFVKVVEGDGSAFDNSQDITLKALDRYIYNRIVNKVYHVPQKVFATISNLHYKTMFVKYSEDKHKKTLFDYTVLGTVFSGDCDTTLANTIRMAMYNRYVNDKAGLQYGQDYVVFSKGDDFSVMYKNYVPDSLINKIYTDYFLGKPKGAAELQDLRSYGLGQICKFLDFGSPNSFKFCSLRSWYIDNDTQHITLTRDPSKLYNLSQYSIKAKSYNWKQLMQYHYDLAESYEANYSGIRIFDMMKEAHLLKAKSIAAFCTSAISGPNRRLICEDKKRKYRDKPLEDFIPTELYNLYYNIKEREQQIKIVEDYWTTMSRIEKDRSDENLTIEQLDMVNKQIAAEFDLHSLSSLLA